MLSLGTAPIVHSSVDRTFERDAVCGKVLSRVLCALQCQHMSSVDSSFVNADWYNFKFQFLTLLAVSCKHVSLTVSPHIIQNYWLQASIFSVQCSLWPVRSADFFVTHNTQETHFTSYQSQVQISWRVIMDFIFGCEWWMVEFIFKILFLFIFTNSLPLPKHKD